ncbi:hypothetical protein C2E23DRAFT_863660 [Lenzites betulinus]|nr:hypothetical protein C2E23DRAFT_863660 [Lenzites betulinus]
MASATQTSQETPDSSWYVLLGKSETGKTQKKPKLSGGSFSDPFPIAFKVPNEELANEILEYRDAIKIIEAGRTTVERWEWGLYPVVYGRECAVFLAYTDALNATRAMEKSIWKKCPTFKRAIAFMISRGQSEKRENLDMRELLDAYTQELLKRLKTVGTQPRSVRYTAEPATSNAADAGYPTSPATPSRSRHARDARSPVPIESPTPMIPNYPFPLTPDLGVRVSQDAVLGGVVYQHTRNLAGIISSHVSPVLDTPKVPSCGAALDMFLQAMGYNMESTLIVAEACQNSQNMDEFVDELCNRGLPILEAKPYQKRVKPPKKTPVEKKLLAERREDAREKITTALANAKDTIAQEAQKMQAEFGGHDQKYYEHQILQSSRAANSQRKVNSWNAYLRADLKRRNDELPDGAPRFSCASKEVMAEIRESWNMLTPEEKAATAEKPLQELEEAREMKQLSVQNVPISAFHDGRATLQSVFEELRQLHARTGIEVGLVAVRTSREHHTPPMTFGTSDRVHEFFQISLHTSMEDVAATMEVYCLSGVSGLLARSVDVIQDLQSRTAALISRKLGEATHQAAKKMFYTGFSDRITSAFGVIIEGWPLREFQPPSSFRTRIELTTLLQAWENKTAQFRKLSVQEWRQWEAQKTDSQLPPGTSVIHAVWFAPGVIQTVTPDTSTPSAASSSTVAGSADASAGSQGPLPAGTPDAVTAPKVTSAKPRKRRADFGKKHTKRTQADSTPAANNATPTPVLPPAAPAVRAAEVPMPAGVTPTPILPTARAAEVPVPAGAAATLRADATSSTMSAWMPVPPYFPPQQDNSFMALLSEASPYGGAFPEYGLSFDEYPAVPNLGLGPLFPSAAPEYPLIPLGVDPLSAGDGNLIFTPSANGQPPDLRMQEDM